MKYFKYLSLAITCCVFCLVACVKEQSDDLTNIFEKDHDPELSIDLGDEVLANFQGVIVNEDRSPMANVVVTIGGQQTQTNDLGKFKFNKATVNDEFALVTAEIDNYFKGYRNLTPSVVETNEVQIMLRKRTIIDQINSEEGGTVYIQDRNHKIEFQAGFVDEYNQPYKGQVQVAAIYIDPLGENIDLEMPGSLKGVNEKNIAVNLISYGMLNVELYGDQDQRLQLADGSLAEIYVKAPSTDKRRQLAEISLWYLSDQKGYWVEYGMSTYKDGYYVGTVSHFTPVNVDDDDDLE